MMMKYTEEVPARANASLNQIDDRTGKIVLSTDWSLPINRYRFFWESSRISGLEETEVVLVLSEVMPGLGTQAQWLLSWLKKQASAARGRLIYSRRIREGWKVADAGAFFIATMKTGSIQARPPGYSRQEGGFILLVDSATEAPDLALTATGPALQDLALSGEFRPGPDFASFLVAADISCVYFPRDDIGRPEVVVLTKERLHLDPGFLVKYE